MSKDGKLDLNEVAKLGAEAVILGTTAGSVAAVAGAIFAEQLLEEQGKKDSKTSGITIEDAVMGVITGSAVGAAGAKAAKAATEATKHFKKK